MASSTDPQLKSALRANDLAAVQARWDAMTERERPSSSELSALLWSQAPRLAPELAQWMLSQGAQPNGLFTDKDGGRYDVLSRAIKAANLPLLDWLIHAQGVSINRPLVPNGPTPLEEALILTAIPAADWLVAQGADLNAADLDGQSLLHKCISHYRVEATLWLVAHGADPTVVNYRDELPCEHVPQGDRVPEPFRPNLMYAFLDGYTTAVEEGHQGPYPIPEDLIDERAIERIGKTYQAVAPEDWTDDQQRAAKIIDAFEARQKAPQADTPVYEAPSY